MTHSYDGFLHRTRKEAEAIASSRGCFVRAPKANELFVDIDSEPAFVVFWKLLGTLNAHETAQIGEVGPSPSGEPGHYHVVVRLGRDVKDEYERVMLQAMLGSDPMRELLSWRRLEDGSDHDAISLFFELNPTPQQFEKVCP